MQFKLQIILLLSLFLYSTSIFSQKAKSESASSVYFAIPPYNIETTDPSKFSYSFAMGKTSFKTPKSFEAEEVCVAAGSKNAFKDAKKIKVFQYSVPAEIKEAFLSIETPNGDVLYAKKFNGFKETGSLLNQTVELIYGDGECYWHPQVLEKAWKENQEAWKKKHHEQIKAPVFEKAQNIAKFKFGYVDYDVNVFTGKGGKGHDYSELDDAQKQAIAAYGKISSEGKINQQSIDQLMVPVKTWLQYIEQINLEDKRAKINRKVVRGLYMNLATAYFQIRDFEKAMKYLGLHGETYKNPTFKGTDGGVINLSALITDQLEGVAANSNLSNDFAVLNEKASSTAKVNIQVKDLGEDMVNELESRHHIYTKDAKKQVAITASGGSIYKNNIRGGRYGPTLIMMTMYDGDLNEFPVEVTQLDVKGLVFTGSYSFKSIPPEIGNMTNLIQINLTASSVSSIPDEIGKLTNLKKLNLSRTQVTTLPESIKNLKNLKLLNIKKTKISAAELAKIKSWLPKGCKVKA